eukprot:GHVS01043935.1.p1 GENE.GHVS01043935.1~~GHVS01043935.1.p1  ORF type:complete len:106 (+),score=12.52 GHVS01043935.1:33-350(+)
MCLRLPLTSQFPCHSPLIRAFLCGSSQSEECVFWSGHRSLENVPLVKIFYPSSPGIYTEHMVPVMRLLCFMYTDEVTLRNIEARQNDSNPPPCCGHALCVRLAHL